MKIQIDTKERTIKLEQSAKLTEIFSLVKKLFPNDEWKQYSLEANTIIYEWANPIIYRDLIHLPPMFETTCETNVFNLEVN